MSTLIVEVAWWERSYLKEKSSLGTRAHPHTSVQSHELPKRGGGEGPAHRTSRQMAPFARVSYRRGAGAHCTAADTPAQGPAWLAHRLSSRKPFQGCCFYRNDS